MAPQFVHHWKEFEDLVAQIYRVSGVAQVERNVNLAGNQIDIYLEEQAPAGHAIRTAVECKYFSTNVSKAAVLQFAGVATFLRQADLIDKAVMVAYLGYTKDAQVVAKAASIDLLSLLDLEARVKSEVFGPRVVQNVSPRPPLPDEFPNLAFIVMPFDEALQDTYLYGIRGACDQAGLQCKRADEIEHAGPIMEEVLDHVKRAAVVIAEVSAHNPNVFYEVGWCHALGRTTLLLAKEGTCLPFDIAHINAIFYKSIKDLEGKLTARLRSLGRPGVA